MTTEAIIGAIALTLTFAGIIGKAVSDLKNEVRTSTSIQVRTESQLGMLTYRLDNVEKGVNKLGETLDDLSGYMSSNSDWQVRKRQQ